MSDDIFDELSRYDEEYRPEQPVMPGLDKLADGDHDFEILGADLGRTAKSQDVILRLQCRVDGALVIEHSYFFGSQTQINKLGADLVSLGFSEFLKPASFSASLKAVLPKLKGIRFRGHKSSDRSAKDNKVYHNLLVISRLGASGTGKAPAAAPTPPPAGRTAKAPPAPPPAPAGDDTIPF